MIYLASLTVPFADHSCVIKFQCNERGVTGMRETVVMERLLAQGEVDFNNLGNVATIADREEYDSLFPDHPLAKARRIIREIIPTVKVSDELRKAEPFKI
jgi:hypothetical protein